MGDGIERIFYFGAWRTLAEFLAKLELPSREEVEALQDAVWGLLMAFPPMDEMYQGTYGTWAYPTPDEPAQLCGIESVTEDRIQIAYKALGGTECIECCGVGRIVEKVWEDSIRRRCDSCDGVGYILPAPVRD